MFLHILVPLDGSPRAERALHMAAAVAQHIITSQSAFVPLITLFRAIDLSTWMEIDAFVDARAQATEKATHYLETQAEGLRKEGLAVETAVRLGNPAEEILTQIMARQVELVVMSTHGRSGLARWVLGSVAERVARSVPVLVLLLPDAAPARFEGTNAQEGLSHPHILVPLDGSATAESAVPPAIELARLLHAEVWVLHVFLSKFEERSLEETSRQWDTNRRHVQQVERYLKGKAATAQQAGVKAHWAFGYGMPGAKIMATAHSQQVSLIVMTTQARGGVVRWRLGSIVEEVLHDSRLPVVLVPSYEMELRSSAEEREEETP